LARKAFGFFCAFGKRKPRSVFHLPILWYNVPKG
jgi:hypothetical protein